MQFSVYYHSQEKGEYLRQVVDSSGSGIVKHFQDLSGLTGMPETDVILLEYQDNNPQLDNWIVQTASKPECPEIFLFVKEAPPQVIWKALKLGARELFSRTIPSEDFRAALVRVELRYARLRGHDLDMSKCPLAPGSEVFLPEETCRDRSTGLLGWVRDRAAWCDV
jgi:hypothetical protein